MATKKKKTVSKVRRCREIILAWKHSSSRGWRYASKRCLSPCVPELTTCEEHATEDALHQVLAMQRQRLERRAPRPAKGLDVKTLQALLERMAVWGLQRGAKLGKREDDLRDARGFAEALMEKVKRKEK